MEKITLKQAYEKGRLLLKNAGYSSGGSLDARVLLLHAAKVSTEFFYTRMDDHRLTDDQYAVYLDFLRLRLARMPVAYIVGNKDFMGLSFLVNRSVLIPRPATETLAERALLHLKSLEKKDPLILDMGTGSGCIGLSILFYHPGATVYASDISPDALKTAEQNCNRLEGLYPDKNISRRFLPLLGDLFEKVPEHLAGSFDLVVSNPPYVTEGEWHDLMDGVRLYEPWEALVPPESAEVFFARLVAGAMDMLTEGGALMVEMGAEQKDMVEGIFAEAGFTGIEVLNDSEGFQRVVAALAP